MARKLLVAVALGALTSASIFAVAAPAGAAPTVTVTSSTVVVNQTADVGLVITKNGVGEISVQELGQPAVLYPNRPAITVNLRESVPTTTLQVILDAPLEGALRIASPGSHEITVRGLEAQLGSLRVDGDDKYQEVHLGVAGEPVQVNGAATIDLDDGVDYLNNGADATVTGNLSVKGVNNMLMGTLTVLGTTKVSTTNEVEQSQTRFAQGFFGRGFKYTGGNGADAVDFDEFGSGQANIKGNATFTLKESDGGFQGVDLSDTIVEGKVIVKGGNDDDQLMTSVTTWITGSVAAKLGHGSSFAMLAGLIEGTKIDVTGGDGPDQVTFSMLAPNALAKVKTGGSDDTLALINLGQLEVAKLTADLGAGTADVFELTGYVLPAGSTVVGVP